MSASDLQAIFIEKGWTLALAESCTGGAIAASIVQIPDASTYFLGSMVVYSNALKEKLLHIPPSLIETHGAVSPECSALLSHNLYKITGATWCCAVTGHAGPNGGLQVSPLGSVYFAFSFQGKDPTIRSYFFKGDRSSIIEQSKQMFFKELISLIKI